MKYIVKYRDDVNRIKKTKKFKDKESAENFYKKTCEELYAKLEEENDSETLYIDNSQEDFGYLEVTDDNDPDVFYSVLMDEI